MSHFEKILARFQKRPFIIAKIKKNGQLVVKVFHVLSELRLAGVAVFILNEGQVISSTLKIKDSPSFLENEFGISTQTIATYLDKEVILIDAEGNVNTSRTLMAIHRESIRTSIDAITKGVIDKHTWSTLTRKAIKL